MDVIMLLLNIVGIVLLFRYLRQFRNDYLAAVDKKAFLSFRRFRYGISLILMVGVALLVANFGLPRLIPAPLFTAGLIHPNTIFWSSVVLAFLISFIWIIYVYRLDIYEPEKWWHLALTFILSGLSTHFLCHWLYGLLDGIGYNLYTSDSLVYTFLYCVFAIGGIEELCKIIPVVLVLLVLRKSINEPYDFILYGSVSALGFAFVENINYLYSSRLYHIGARALYAAVAHMTFTSIICYGLMLWRFKYSRIRGILLLPLVFLLAIGSHGFYDFWLLNYDLVDYRGMTTVFFLLTVHLWVNMKNNAINISNFYTTDAKLENDGLRHFLIISLTGLLMLGYLIVTVLDGKIEANAYLLTNATAFAYLIFYLAIGMSRYRVVKGRINPFQVPFDFFIPRPIREDREEV